MHRGGELCLSELALLDALRYVLLEDSDARRRGILLLRQVRVGVGVGVGVGVRVGVRVWFRVIGSGSGLEPGQLHLEVGHDLGGDILLGREHQLL